MEQDLKQVQLKDFLIINEVIKGLESNLLNSAYHNNNQLSLNKLIDINLIENNTLVLGKDTIEYGIYFDKHKEIYLFEARRFENEEKMVNALLLLFDKELNILTDEIDDVWTYGEFESLF